MARLLHHPVPFNRPASTSSEYSSIATATDGEMAANARDIAPYEPLVCDVLIDEIRAFSQPGTAISASQHGLSAYHVDSLAMGIRQAAVTIRFNAKWFAPADLSTLLVVALVAATQSSSSADLYAALELLDTVGVYSFLPPVCLLPAARFISYAYHQGGRMHRLKKLSDNAWSTSQRVLQFHLGQQYIGALLAIVGSDTEQPLSKAKFAETAGALQIVARHLQEGGQGGAQVDIMMLIRQLHVAAGVDDPVFREHLGGVVCAILADDEHVRAVERDAAWRVLLQVIERCTINTLDSDTSQELVRKLLGRVSDIEPRQLYMVARLVVAVEMPLTAALFQELMTLSMSQLRSDFWSEELESMLEMLSVKSMYSTELQILVNGSTDLLYGTRQHVHLLENLTRVFAAFISAPATSPEAAVNFAGGLIRLFAFETSSCGTTITFDALCATALLNPTIATTLLSIRVDVAGAQYIDMDIVRAIDLEPSRDDHAFLAAALNLPLQKWHELMGRVLCVEYPVRWDVYNRFLVGIPAILSNHAQFAGQIEIIKAIQAALCDRLTRGDYPEPPPESGVTKSHVAAKWIGMLGSSMSYHHHLSKTEIQSLIAVFIQTAGSRDYIVSIECIHALTICCYEVPDKMTAYMDEVIDKMSKMITQRYLAIHVLQFLLGLSRLPDLYHNFTQMDYKKIFGVCYSYLQSTRGATTSIERKRTPTSEHSSLNRGEEALPEYVYALAHHVMTFWYISLKPQDRDGLKPYITSCLTYEGPDGEKVVEDQGMVTIDLMDRVDADVRSLADTTGYTPVAGIRMEPFKPSDGRLVESHRLIGLLIISSKTSLRNSISLVTVRRPSGTTQWVVGKGRATITVAGGDDEGMSIIPVDTKGTTYGTIAIPSPDSLLGSADVIFLPDEPAITRAIQSLDRTSALDSHKAGVIYIGEKQTSACDIFDNISGSPDYREFVEGLGSLRKLEGATFNTQGLDRMDNMDGHHTVVWNSDITELVFHVTTMMPNHPHLDASQNAAQKKRHIGNDYVNVIFNNSGTQLDYTALYNTFPSAFGYVYIVITPSARTSFLQTRTAAVTADSRDRFYKVRVVTRPDYPLVSPAAVEKVISGASLPGFVRNLALNDCIMSLMREPRSGAGEYPSSWKGRLQQIRRLGERYRSRSLGI